MDWGEFTAGDEEDEELGSILAAVVGVLSAGRGTFTVTTRANSNCKLSSMVHRVLLRANTVLLASTVTRNSKEFAMSRVKLW